MHRCPMPIAWACFCKTTRFLAADGEHQGEITLQGVRVKMNDVSRITVTPDYFFLDTGSPHYVKVVADAFQTDVVTASRMIRYAPSFQPGGTNVNFITPHSGMYPNRYL